MASEEDNDYVPSQDVGTFRSSKRARRGPELAIATHKLDELYCVGGALDSQTTDSQYVNGLTEETLGFPQDILPPLSPSKTREVDVVAASQVNRCNDTVCECAQNKRTVYALVERIEDLEATLHEMQRTIGKLEQSIEVLKSGTQCADSDDSDDDDKIPVYDFGGEIIWMKKDYPSQVVVSPPHSKRARIMRTAQLTAPRFLQCHSKEGTSSSRSRRTMH
ncbi:hypothetical protein BC629DRAFT_1549190 [Irpex lacteus]|nr:hypothetical protein BC629DRAFT_1549190 [Irpex lacteus]